MFCIGGLLVDQELRERSDEWNCTRFSEFCIAKETIKSTLKKERRLATHTPDGRSTSSGGARR